MKMESPARNDTSAGALKMQNQFLSLLLAVRRMDGYSLFPGD